MHVEERSQKRRQKKWPTGEIYPAYDLHFEKDVVHLHACEMVGEARAMGWKTSRFFLGGYRSMSTLGIHSRVFANKHSKCPITNTKTAYV
jgi:hypothetical protein